MSRKRKLVVSCLLGVLMLAGALVAIVIDGVMQISSDMNNYYEMTEMVTVTSDICRPNDYLCEGRLILDEYACFSPFLGKEGKLVCIHGLIAATNRKLHPELADANLKPEQVSRWAKDAVKVIMETDYKNPKKRYEDNPLYYFTLTGFMRFLGDFNDTNIFEIVKAKKLAASYVSYGEPKINKTYVEDNLYTLEIGLSAQIHLKPADAAGNGEIPDPVDIDLLLKIVRSDMNAEGIGIAKLIAVQKENQK